MRAEKLLALVALAACAKAPQAPAPTPTPVGLRSMSSAVMALAATAGAYCRTEDGSRCIPNLFGSTCPNEYPVGSSVPCPPATPGPSPTPRRTATPTATRTPTAEPTPPVEGGESGAFRYLPDGTNYIESPWVMRMANGDVYLGGHAGWCCVMPADDGRDSDRWWVVKYGFGYGRGNVYFTGDPGCYDDQEIGGVSALRLDGRWIISAQRTERSYWTQGNRLRPFIVYAADFFYGPFDVDRSPISYPLDSRCKEMGDVDEACKQSIGIGQHNSLTTSEDGRILVLGKDDVGVMKASSLYAVYQLDLQARAAHFMYETDWGMKSPTEPWRPSFGDWGRGKDGRFYAYTTEKEIWEWYAGKSVVEWVSDNEGAAWAKTGRRWSPGVQCLWDVAVMKDEAGVIASPLTLVANADEKCGWATEYGWHFWWWTEDRAALPSAFGSLPPSEAVTFKSGPREDYRDRPLTMTYTASNTYCIHVLHENGPWMGQTNTMCAFGGGEGRKYTDTQISLRGCGARCAVPPHRVSVTAWGISNVTLANRPRGGP